jgi:O-antigen/teichoic acid export membrane protein
VNVRAFTSKLADRPTLWAQVAGAATSLVLIGVYARSMAVTDFASYSAIFATYAFGNALVGTSIGTRIIEEASRGSRAPTRLSLRGEGGAILLALATALIIPALTSAAPAIFAAAAVGMLTTIAAEVANARLIGQQRFAAYARLTIARSVVWILAAVGSVLVLDRDDLLLASLFAAAVASLTPVVGCIIERGLVLTTGRRDTRQSGVSWVGLSNLALWILATGDRVILADVALVALATYATLYGLLDRIFRTVANAELLLRLPSAFGAADGKQSGTTKPTWSVAASLAAAAAVSAVVSPFAVGVISGGVYTPSLWMALVLSAAMAAMLAAVPLYAAAIGRGDTRGPAILACAAASLNLGGNLILAPHFGTTSAAALTLAGYAVWLVGLILLTRRAETARAAHPLKPAFDRPVA